MTAKKSFWEEDRTTIHAKTGWFRKMQPLQKIIYLLLLIFIISWCFYLGMSFAFAIAPQIQVQILSGTDLIINKTALPTKLEGMDITLLVGADKRPEETAFRTDNIVLIFSDVASNEIKLLTIPRDSYVQLPGKSTKMRINESYFYGGITLLKNTMEYTFGINIDHYIALDFASLAPMIDLFGGVEIEVLADTGNMEQQQLLMQALANKMAASSSSMLLKTPQLIKIILNNCTTDYTLSQLMKLTTPLTNTDLANTKTYSLPGSSMYLERGGLWENYWILDKEACKSVIEEIIGADLGELHIIDDGGAGLKNPPNNNKQK